MAVLDLRAVASTLGIVCLVWLSSKILWLLKDRRRVQKFVSLILSLPEDLAISLRGHNGSKYESGKI
jgi:hypothetical protein